MNEDIRLPMRLGDLLFCVVVIALGFAIMGIMKVTADRRVAHAAEGIQAELAISNEQRGPCGTCIYHQEDCKAAGSGLLWCEPK